MNDEKAKLLGAMFDRIDAARFAAARARRDLEAAEALVDNVLAEARAFMLTD
jgi:hypothetical protein